jgi:arsenate reductase
MDQPRFFGYAGCGTCRKARAWLVERGVGFQEVAIRETPPSAADLGRLLAAYAGNRRAILNTSGGDYREPGMKERLAAMDDAEFLATLAARGNLIRRPVWLADDCALAGFSPDAWQAAIG